jgi:hypothetical protein
MRQIETILKEGDATCIQNQVISSERQNEGSAWSCLQNNNNNEYNLDLSSGNSNNNNKYNVYAVVPVESFDVESLVLMAEEDCWSNKHSSWEANKYHYTREEWITTLSNSLKNGGYEIGEGICFIKKNPKPREIFAAKYPDRVIHHMVSGYMLDVSEAVHTANGNVSYGNRRGVSARHACAKLQQYMQKHPHGYVIGLDVKSFFMSIDKETAWEIFCEYERRYRPIGYTEEMRAFLMGIIHKLILHDPSLKCQRRSPEEDWVLIPMEKSLFFVKGLPIGNFYSQIIANLLLEVVCEVLRKFDMVEFVDDFGVVVDNKEEIKEVINLFINSLAKIKLKCNLKKIYVQPVCHGIKWCGYFIYPNRMYASDRIVKNANRKIHSLIVQEPSPETAKQLVSSFNSYSGLFKDCAAYNIQKKLVLEVMGSPFKKYVYFQSKNSRFVCKLKNLYKNEDFVTETDIYFKKIKYEKKNNRMIVTPISKNAPRFEKQGRVYVYRYGYQTLDDNTVIACVEESITKLPLEKIKTQVLKYNSANNINEIFDPSAYGF